MSDSMRYDPTTKRITATGNVHFTRPDGEMYGDLGIGNADGRQFEMHGNVRGIFPENELEVLCESIHMESLDPEGTRRRITAAGRVILTSGADKLTAEEVAWEPGTDNYSADGKVLASFGTHYLDSDSVARSGDEFSAAGVRTYQDRSRNLTLSASRANGAIQNGEVAELTAAGSLVVTMPDAEGVMTRITGNRGLFSTARGTVVVTGNAEATQGGRYLQAADIVYHLDSGRLEALGRPSLVIEQERR